MHTKSNITSLLLISLGLLSVSATEVEDCVEDKVPQPIVVDIKGCEKQPCELIRGQDVVMTMNFTAPVPIDRLRSNVLAEPDGNQGSITVPLLGNVCKQLTNTHCPLEINEPAQYKLTMPVLNAYPKTGLRLEFSLIHNGGSEKLVCFSVNCQVI